MLKNIISMWLNYELKNFFMNHENDFEKFFIKSLKWTYINYKNNFTKNFKIESVEIIFDNKITPIWNNKIFVNLSVEDEVIQVAFNNNFYMKKSENYSKISFLDIFYKMHKNF